MFFKCTFSTYHIYKWLVKLDGIDDSFVMINMMNLLLQRFMNNYNSPIQLQ